MKEVSCPHCGATGTPKRVWAANSWLAFALPFAVWLIAFALASPVHGNLFNEVLAVTTIFGVPAAIILGALARSPACSACGWRYIVTVDQAAKAPHPTAE